MAEVQIYKLDLSAGDISVPGFYGSSSWEAGSDAPMAGYPEFGQLENIHRRESAGALGQHVIDAVDTADYTISWVTLCGIGPLAQGQWDARGGGPSAPIKVRWRQQLRASAIAEAEYNAPLALCNGGGGGTGNGLFGSNIFFQLEMNAGAPSFPDPPGFRWAVRYRYPLAPGPSQPFQLATVEGANGTCDGAEHELLVSLVPATVTNAFAGNGFQGPGVVAADGSFYVAMDGDVLVAAIGIPLVINHYATTNPEVYFGKTIWHGD